MTKKQAEAAARSNATVAEDLYESCPRCGDRKRKDSSCECQLTEAERATGVE
jgi:hypothetical protein